MCAEGSTLKRTMLGDFFAWKVKRGSCIQNCWWSVSKSRTAQCMGTEKGTYSSRAPRVQSGKFYTCHSKLHEKPEEIRWTRGECRLVKSNRCGKLEIEYMKLRSKDRLVWEGGTLYREQRFRPRERWDWIPSLTPPSWEPPLPPVLPTGGRGD